MTVTHAAENVPLLSVRGLKKYYPVGGGFLRPPKFYVKAVDGIDLDIGYGESVGLVGESGSGKTTVGRSLLLLTPPTAGQITFAGDDLSSLSGPALRKLRQEMQFVFQNPYSSLDPRLKVKQLIQEPLIIHRIGTQQERRARVKELIGLVNLTEDSLERYPHEFSGGQRQRIGIARALALNPKLLILDEPTSALDVSVQATILNLLLDLQAQIKLSYLFISHDLGVIRYLCQRVAIMYMGRIVEQGPTEAIFNHPQHPYTLALLSAMPTATTVKTAATEIVLEGEVSYRTLGLGCRFAPRCPAAKIARCAEVDPELREVAPGQAAACHLAHEGLPLGIEQRVDAR